MNLKQKNNIGLFIIILATAIVSRFYGLDRLSLWADELWVVLASVSGSLADMISAVYYNDNHPPGYYLLLRYTQLLLGTSDFAIRLPSALAGIALVAVTFFSGKKIFSENTALIATALVAGSYQAIYYSQEARPNIFVALFILLSLHYFYTIVFEGGRRKNYFLFWLSAASASYFHYAGLVFCACLALAFLPVFVVRHKKEDFIVGLKVGLKLFLPVLLLYSPWLLGVFQHLVSTPVTAWQRPPDWNTLQTTFQFLFGPDNIRLFFYTAVFLLTIIIIAWSACIALLNTQHRRVLPGKWMAMLLLLAMIVLPVAVFYIKSRFSQDAYNHRHFLYAIPLLALLAGHGVDNIIQRFPQQLHARMLLSIVVIILLYQAAANNGRALYTANHFKQEFREVAQVVANNVNAMNLDPAGQNKIMIVSNTEFFDHYLNRFTDPRHKSEFIFNWDQKLPELSLLINNSHVSEFYYLEAPIVPGANNMITAEDLALAGHYTALCRTRYARAQLFKFSVTNVSHNTDLLNLTDCRVNKNE